MKAVALAVSGQEPEPAAPPIARPGARSDEAAERLRYVSRDALPIRRRRCGRGFLYLDARGRRICDERVLARIRSLAIPPNYRQVSIADDPQAHLQATGLDDAGRLQYRYHPGWEAVREHEKLDRLAVMARAIPRIRGRVTRDLARPDLCKERVLAGVVQVLDRTHIRIGGENYVHSGRTRGAATLLKSQVKLEAADVCLAFRGKGGQEVRCAVDAPALARLVADLRRLPGPRLFQYRDGGGTVHRIASTDVNAYLQAIAGEAVSAKDFRTLAANAVAAARLAKLEPAESATKRRRQVAGVVREVAEMLGNTPAVARKSYIHAWVVEAFEEGRLAQLALRAPGRSRTTRGEALVSALLRRRPRRDPVEVLR